MICFQGRSAMKQYMPAKLTKWGFKSWTLAEAASGYVCNFDIYTGKMDGPSGKGLAYDVVVFLTRPYMYLRHSIHLEVVPFTTMYHRAVVRLFSFLL